NPRQQRRLDQLEPAIAARLGVLREAVALRKNRGLEAAVQEIRIGHGQKTMDDIRRVIDEMENEERALLDQRAQQEKARARHTEWTYILVSSASFALLVLGGSFLTRNIAGPLREISAAAQGLASGDLAVSMPVDSRRDEVGVLAQSFTRITESL